MTNEDSLKKPGGFSAEKRSFTNELTAAFHHLKRITEKIESNFSQRCTEIGQEAMTRKKAVRYRRGKKNHKVNGYRSEERHRETVKSQSLDSLPSSWIGP